MGKDMMRLQVDARKTNQTRGTRIAAHAAIVSILIAGMSDGRAQTGPSSAPPHASKKSPTPAPQPRPSNQTPKAQWLVFESVVGARPAHLENHISRIRGAFSDVGYSAITTDVVNDIADGLVPRLGAQNPRTSNVTEILKALDEGYQTYKRDLKFKLAVEQIQRALVLTDNNPTWLVKDTGFQQSVTKAYIALSLSLIKLDRRDEATAVMTELCRILGAPPSLRTEHGGDADEFARSTYKRASAEGLGALTITANNPRALIFVDRVFRGVGTITLEKLLPGKYQVLLQEPNTVGLRYWAEVRAKQHSRLDADLAADQLLVVSDSSIAASFRNDRHREREGEVLASIARRWTARPPFATFAPAQLDGEPVFVGTLYGFDGKWIRHVYIPIAAALDAQTPASFVSAVINGTPAPGIQIVTNTAAAPARARATQTGSHRSLLVTGAGVALLTVGTILQKTVEPEPDGQQTKYLHSKPGIGFAIAGGVVIAAGMYLRLRDTWETRQPVLPYVLTVIGIVAAETGIILYVTDEDKPAPPREQYNDSALAGAVLGGVGVAATIVGGIWWWRSTKSTIVPQVSVSREHAFVGFTTTF